MRKITIEFDDSDIALHAIDASKQAIRDNAHRLKDQNIKVQWDKGMKTGVITQKGVSIGLLRRDL